MCFENVALRGESALKARLPKEAKKNASISPYDRGILETHLFPAFDNPIWERPAPCVGDLLMLTRKGKWLIAIMFQKTTCILKVTLDNW